MQGMKSLVVGLALCVVAAAPASACWLCASTGGYPDCEYVTGETGGTDCFINCSGVKCYCRTLGVCGGSNGCGGQPCPVLHTKPDVFGGGDREGTVWLTKELFDQMSLSDPDAALLLASLTTGVDTLHAGLWNRVPFIVGNFQGLFTETLPDSEGHNKAYKYTASVVPQGDGSLRVDLKVFGHPKIRGLAAEIRNDASGSFVEVQRRNGELSRIDL